MTLSRTGEVLATDQRKPATVAAIALGLPGPVVQVGRTVTVGTSSVTLPTGALVLDYRQATIVYRKGSQVRARVVSSGADSLLQVIVGQALADAAASPPTASGPRGRRARPSAGGPARSHSGATKTSQIEPSRRAAVTT